MRGWNKVFNNNNPIYIEIGCGKGDFIIENAKRYPNINFIGIEMYDTVLMYAINKLKDESLNSSFSSVQFSRSVVFNSLRPRESQHARPPCPSPTPGVHSDSCPSNQ